MPIYMDRHELPGVTAQDVAEAHQEDLKIQHLYECKALTYWFDEERQTAFCLIEAPSKKAVIELHRNAHGLIPHQIIEVDSELVESFLGRIKNSENLTDIAEGSIFRIIMAFQIERQEVIGASSTKYSFQLPAAAEMDLIKSLLGSFNGQVAAREDKMLLCSFTSAVQAIQCAVAIRKELLHKYREGTTCIELKFGLYGDQAINGQEHFFLEYISMARHLCMISRHNAIVVSHSVQEQCLQEEALFQTLADDLKVLSLAEERLLIQLTEVLNDSIYLSGFTISDLAQKMGVSKSQLYRNMATITDLSPSELLKEFKMYRALILMEQHIKTIAEIAYETGFGSPSYFSKCFKRRYGISPSAYIDSFSR
ncbi:nickel-binding protein [Carboxylicivirga taeanensis]|uniref:nickel-binding protein n=1 Tax=Carboxylicivirga taeanensis TaxID=1416875 RepID=UPI003F6E2A19